MMMMMHKQKARHTNMQTDALITIHCPLPDLGSVIDRLGDRIYYRNCKSSTIYCCLGLYTETTEKID